MNVSVRHRDSWAAFDPKELVVVSCSAVVSPATIRTRNCGTALLLLLEKAPGAAPPVAALLLPLRLCHLSV